MGTDRAVILFDGVCNLCNSSIQFVIRHDKKRKFRFAALQSDYAIGQLQKLNIPVGEMNSIILLTDRVYQQSDAALEIARHLSGAWPALYIFKIVPRFIRDWVYNWISRNRYRMFGKRDQCMIPTPELRERFVDGL